MAAEPSAPATQAGERLADVGRGITLCYEALGDPRDPPLLLVMGLGMQLIAWRDDFCQQLVDRGLYVIRYDNRDAGRSTSVDVPPPGLRQLVTRRFDPGQYALADMADDASGLLSALDLGSAHVVGVSLGGMIAQTLAARHPDSVRTLTSIMSSTGEWHRGLPALGVYRYLLGQAPSDRDAFVEYAAELFDAIGSPDFSTEPQEIRERAERSFDRGTNPAGSARQLAAVLKSGDRTRELTRIGAPTLVIHGSRDRMIHRSGGRATAAAIPGAELMVIEGMGHDLPRALWPRIVSAIADLAGAADGARA